MNLSIRQLKIFVALAHSLNFSRTADSVHVTQPTLTKIIREIELELGVRLFDRNTRHVTMTEDGAALLAAAMPLIADYDEGITSLYDLVGHRAQRLGIAAVPTLAAMMLPRVVAAMREESPGMTFQIHDVAPEIALDLLRTRKVDLALASVNALYDDLVYEEVLRDEFVLLSSRDLALEIDQPVWSEAVLGRLPLITLPRDSLGRRHLDAFFSRRNRQFRPMLELGTLLTIQSFVQAGQGAALLPRLSAQFIRKPDMVITALAGAPHRSAGIVTRRGETMSGLAARMAAAIRDIAGALSTPLPHA